ncbi:MAG: hypothetical protein ACFFAH_11240 [Promethearchaeota archaeon]
MFSIVELNKLTVNQLVQLAKDCNLTLKGRLKADKIKEIETSGLGEGKIQELFNKYYKPRKSVKKKPAKKGDTLTTRVVLLEKQVKYVMDKISSIELILSHLKPEKKGLSNNEYQNIKLKILSLIKPGRSMTIDEIYQIKEFKNYSLKKLGTAIDDLVDEELFDVSEGGSKLRIHDNIGRIIRR